MSIEDIQPDLTKAFRIVDEWSNDDRLNTAVQFRIFQARTALQSALENLYYTEKEIEQRRHKEESMQSEQEEQVWREKQEELYHQIDELVEYLDGKVYPKKLTIPQCKTIEEVIQPCLRRRDLSEEDSNVISSILKEY